MKSSDNMYDKISAEIKPYLGKNMNVLELACGTGQLTYRLFGNVSLWEATDFSENMIAEAKKLNRSQRLKFSPQDATNLPYAAQSFNAVVMANALHIMPEPEKALCEIHRVLKDEGLLFAPTFVWDEKSVTVVSRIKQRLMQAAGFKVYSKWSAGDFALFVEKNGFEVTEDKLFGNGLAPLCCLIAKKR